MFKCQPSKRGISSILIIIKNELIKMVMDPFHVKFKCSSKLMHYCLIQVEQPKDDHLRLLSHGG